MTYQEMKDRARWELMDQDDRNVALGLKRVRLVKEYIEKIGYDPTEDCPDITTYEIEQTLREWDEEVRLHSGG